jgi:ribosome-associated protein
LFSRPAGPKEKSMPEIKGRLQVPENELSWTFVRSSGPGGQNVNKVASKAVLRWHMAANTSIPDEVKVRLKFLQRNRITVEGDLLVQSQRFRDQERNRADCLDKLRDLVSQAAARPRPRKATQPTRGARERRLQTKRRRGQIKAGRRRPAAD